MDIREHNFNDARVGALLVVAWWAWGDLFKSLLVLAVVGCAYKIMKRNRARLAEHQN